MLIIKDAHALERALLSTLDPVAKRLLATRRDQLLADTGGDYDLSDLAHVVIVEPPDGVAQIEAAAGYPLLTEPAFEWVARHDGWLEAVTILSDDGFGLVLLAPDDDAVDPLVLSVLREHAEPVTAMTAGQG